MSNRYPMGSNYYCRRPYGFWAFVGDAFMTIITAGFWLIWVFVREMRRR